MKLPFDIYKLSVKKRLLWGFTLSAAVSLSVTLIAFSIPAISVLEWQMSDSWAREGYGHTVSNNVAVVGVDEEFLNTHGWPLEKDLYGDFIDYLLEMGARVIALDIIFADNLESCDKNDSMFRELIGYSSNVVLAYGARFSDFEFNVHRRSHMIPSRYAIAKGTIKGLEASGGVLPYRALLDKATHMGFFNLARPFPDGIDRRIPLLISQDSLIYPSFALSACFLFDSTGTSLKRQGNRLFVNDKEIPVDREGYLCVDFSDSIPVYTMTDLRKSHKAWLQGNSPSIGREQLHGRIVFIGNTALSLGDFGITPLSAREGLGRSPNVLMHARAASTILKGTGLRSNERPAAVLTSIIIIAAIAVLFYLLSPQIAVTGAFLIFGFVYFLSRYLYSSGYFLPVLEGICSGSLFSVFGSLIVYFEKEVDRKFLFNTFSTYLSSDIINEMHKERIKPELGGEMVYATAFFSDIENFTTISEQLSPVDLISYLNEYFSTMTGILLNNNGTLDKYIGDSIVAFFGAPKPTHCHAFDACRAAVLMQEALERLREQWMNDSARKHLTAIKMRIGINTGHFVTGNVGCSLRMNYTMLGDTVNLASRFEGAAKEYGADTIVGEQTFDLVRHDFLFRCLDNIRVKGRSEPVLIYQLMGFAEKSDDRVRELISKYENAFELYRKGEFESAAAVFDGAITLENSPDLRNPSSVMAKRCRKLMEEPVLDWDGIYNISMG